MLQNIGINKVYYSMDKNIYCEKIATMISVNTSSSSRLFEKIYYNAPSNLNQYYKNILKKMPNIINKYNLIPFIKHLKDEIIGSSYKIIHYNNNNELILYLNGEIIGKFFLCLRQEP
jgi:hypothetical protein